MAEKLAAAANVHDSSPLKRKATDSENILVGKDSAKKPKYEDDDRKKRKGSPDHRERRKKAKRSKEEKHKHKQDRQLKREVVDDSFYEDDFGTWFYTQNSTRQLAKARSQFLHYIINTVIL